MGSNQVGKVRSFLLNNHSQMSEPAQETVKDSASGAVTESSPDMNHVSANGSTLGSSSEAKDDVAASSEMESARHDSPSASAAARDGTSDSESHNSKVSTGEVDGQKDDPPTGEKKTGGVGDGHTTETNHGHMEEQNDDAINEKKTPSDTAADNKTEDADSKRKSESEVSGPNQKKVKTEESKDTEPSPLENAKQAAEQARIAMLPELDPVEEPSPGTGLPKHQHKYALSAIRAIKRLKDAAPFVAPVDPVRQGVPQYFEYIKNPMDLGTMEKKLVESKYDTIKNIVDDFNLIVSNCIIFNGSEAMISKMALSIAQSFKKQLSNMPTFDATRKGSQAAAAAATASAQPGRHDASHANSPAAASGTTVVEDPAAAHDDHVGKRSSTTTTVLGPNGLPTLRRKSLIDGRPKRDVRPPRHTGSYVGSGSGEGRPRNKKYTAELRFAGQVLREMQGRKLENIAFPFLAPVDPIEQGVPHYFDVIKEPMDLSTIQKKLTEGIYYNGDEFESDIRLMFRNCYTFNPQGTPVNVMGHKLEAYFDSRWIEKPIPGAHAEESDVSDLDEEYAESGMTNPAIDILEEQVRNIRKQIKRLKRDALAEYYKRGHRRTAAPKRRRSSSTGHGRSLPTEMTYEMKRELRDKIDKLPEKKIRIVLAIIQESMPDLGNSGQEEIELEVDSLDQTTLLRLYNYAVLGRREEAGNVSGAAAASNTTPTGGYNGSASDFDAAGQPSKRRSKALSEEEHVRKIAEIESKLKEFDNAASPSTSNSALAAAGSAVSGSADADSDSSDDEPQQFDSDDSSSEEE